MRIVARPDFDGIVCAVLLMQAEKIDCPVYWVEPNKIQKNQADIRQGDIIANLPWAQGCSMWFDHHVSNTPDRQFEGAFEIAPSAAGVVLKYYKAQNRIDDRFDELVRNTDMIDSADLDMDQVRHPENYPYILLSMTIKNHGYSDIPYWNHLIELLSENHIDRVMEDPQVKQRCKNIAEENRKYEKFLVKHTKILGNISVTDFRCLDPVPEGNRFLVYSLFPECIASVKIRFDSPGKKNILLSIGHSIFNRRCRVNTGKLLARFGGGGHAGAGGCTLDPETADRDIALILDILARNKKDF